MDADRAIGMGEAETGGNEGAPIAALRPEAPVAELFDHQLGQAVGDRLDRKTGLARGEGEAEARQRRCDHGEGIARIAAVARRVGQARDEVEELEHRARPAVQEQQRHRVRPGSRHMQIVQVDPVQRHLELRQRVQPRFLRPPVEPVGPIGRQLPQIGEIRAIGPRLARRLVREARALQPIAQVGNLPIRHLECERNAASTCHCQKSRPCSAQARAMTISWTSLAPSTSRAWRA